MEIILLMNQLHDYALQEIKLCSCRFCHYRAESSRLCSASDVATSNSMGEFIKMLPVGFPLAIEQTVVLHRTEEGLIEYHSYFNQQEGKGREGVNQKSSISHQTLKSIGSMTCQNVQIYFSRSEKIFSKYQAASFLASNKGEGVEYAQPYQHSPVIRIEYPSQLQCSLDNILKEYLTKELERFKGDNYKFNEEFLDWIFREYGEDLFFYFLTELYARIFRATTRGEIQYAIFFWVAERSSKDILTVQKKGSERQKYNTMQELGRPQSLNFRPKLVNVRELKVRTVEKLFSFEDQYQSLIKQRIASSTKQTITAIKNKAYRSRLEVFRGKIQEVYKLEQKTIMEGVQQEKQFEYQVDSQKMARLLIPTLGPNQNLRQVLNNQQAFRKVFLSKKKDRNFITFPNLNKTGFRRKSLKNNPEKSLHTGSRVKRRYQKLLTSPSTHE